MMNHILPPTSEIKLWLDQANAFIGRDDDLDRLTELLDGDHRLVTLFGAPGAGKTRLCAQWLANHEDRRVIVCELEHQQTRQQLWGALAESLSLRELEPLDPERANAQILKALSYAEPCVLILDNFEQLTPHADLLLEWSKAAPAHRILVTTRHRLQMRGERGLLLEGLSREAARELFSQRAIELLGFFEPDDEELAMLDRIIDYFDGMPLAIELCASQLFMRSIPHILESLEHESLDMQNAWSDVPDRQRSLRDAMGTTWVLLDDHTRDVLGALSLFRGAFDARDGMSLCKELKKPLPPVLLTLRNHSLLRPVEGHRGAPMFKLSAIARHYAREQYADDPSRDALAERYATCVLSACVGALEQAERTDTDRDRDAFWARSPDLYAIAREEVPGLDHTHTARAGLLLQQAHRRMRVLGRDEEVELSRLERLTPLLDEDDPELSIEIAIERAWADLSSGVLTEAMLDAIDQRALESDHHRARGDCEQLRARIAARDVRLHDAIAHEISAREHYRTASNRTLEAQATLEALMFAITSTQTGIPSSPDAESLLIDAERLCARLDHPVFDHELEYLRAFLVSTRGDLDEAIERARGAIERARERRDSRSEIRWLRQYHYWNVRVGDRQHAISLGDDYIALSKRLGVYTVSIVIQQALAMIDGGDHAHASALLNRELDLTSPNLSTYARAPAHVIRALHALLSHDTSRGLRECDLAVNEYRSNDARSGLAFALGIRSVARALLGESSASLDDLQEARGMLDPARAQDASRLLALDCFELARTPDATAREEALAQIREETEHDIVSRLAYRLVTNLGDAIEEGVIEPATVEHDLQIALDATWFSITEADEEVNLKRRKALRLILAELVRRYRDAPGEGMSMYELIEIGWPDENLDLESGTNRVRAAIHTLRSLGLRELLVNIDGYMLDPQKNILVIANDLT